MPMWGYPYSYGAGGVLLGLAIMLLCLSALGLLIWYALSLIEWRERRHSLNDGPGALATLQQRYARGELDEPTFLRMRESLSQCEVGPPHEPATPR